MWYLADFPMLAKLADDSQTKRTYHILQIFGIPESDHFGKISCPFREREVPSNIRSAGSSDSPTLSS